MRIACIIDTSGKVQHNRIRLLRKYVNAELKVFLPDEKIKTNDFDIIYYANVGLYGKKRISHPRLCGSITSHKPYRHLKVFDKISVNNAILFDEYKYIHRNIIYIPNGVDTKQFDFSSIDLSLPLHIGWVGNIDREVKNFNIIKRLMKRYENDSRYKFKIVGTEKHQAFKRLKSIEQMVDFYKSLHVLLVVSSSEGTPNPALEAASCGVPIITSYVGNMPELINESNGWIAKPKENMYDFVKRTLSSITVMDKNIYANMRNQIRLDIEEKWDWEKLAVLYNDFFTKW